MVKSWILNSLSKELASRVIYADCGFEIWSNLHERFSQLNASCIFQIERDIISLKQAQLSVITYFTRLKALWDEISNLQTFPISTCSANKTIAEFQQHRLIQFLMGLNDSYAMVREQILVMDPLPSVNRAYSLILQEERQRNVIATGQPSLETTALAAQQYNQFARKQNTKGLKNERPTCGHCG
ncbi:hypothetical protein ACOSQ2_029204 [Xanthoceras sorbifolium]